MKASRLLEERWHLRPGATPNEIRRTEAALGVVFPDDYIEIVTWFDGGDFRIGEKYLRLWSLREVVERNARLEVPSFLPSMVAIGNDAGDMLYLFDFAKDSAAPRLVEIEAGSMCLGAFTVQGSSLTDALYAWSGLERARVALLQCLMARAMKEAVGDEDLQGVRTPS